MVDDEMTDGSSVHEHEFRAMATTFQLLCRCDELGAGAVDAAFADVERDVRRLERMVSRFERRSAVEQLNAAGTAAVPPEVVDIITRALDDARGTGGRFDITVHGALARGWSSSDPDGGAGWRRGDVMVDARRGRVTMSQGTRIDLGGIIWGWVADRSCRRLFEVGSCLVSAGGDIAVMTREGEQGWPVGVGTQGRTLEVATGGIAMSSQSQRGWVAAGVDGSEQWHVIDPSTGLPAPAHGMTVTVIAESCTTADVWATALIVAGDEAIEVADASRVACLVEWPGGRHQASRAFPAEN